MEDKEEEEYKQDSQIQQDTPSKGSDSKGRSCKGCLYYSSQIKNNQRNPLCVGFSSALQQAPNYIGESDIDVSKEGRSLSDFKYACLGYSAYADKKDSPTDQQGQAELPFCVGIEESSNGEMNVQMVLWTRSGPYGNFRELLVDRRPTAATVHEQVQKKEDIPSLPRPPSTYRPPHTIGDEFLSRFYRNAGLVAGGVARNLYRIGNYVKDNLDDILYPYRRRPK